MEIVSVTVVGHFSDYTSIRVDAQAEDGTVSKHWLILRANYNASQVGNLAYTLATCSPDRGVTEKLPDQWADHVTAECIKAAVRAKYPIMVQTEVERISLIGRANALIERRDSDGLIPGKSG